MKCCDHMKLKEIIKEEKAKIWLFLVFTKEYNKYYICENCAKIHK